MKKLREMVSHFIAQKIFMARARLEPEIVNGGMHKYYIRRIWIDRMKQLNIDNRMFAGSFPKVGQKGIRGGLVTLIHTTFLRGKVNLSQLKRNKYE
ncbi:hypothetical protein [Gilliamella mensalis]|uniref:hypothetical protein n=1 Tax=Gilliamella mensalis TaxID=1908520 RepID=UPI000A162F47|nr:hypothetical protein [Gilliamella mensalis]